MERKSIMPVQLFCTHYNVEYSFIDALQEVGLIELVTVDETQCIKEEQISELERIMRLHYDLDINMEGIDVVFNLLRQLEDLQEELRSVKNRLNLYEGNE